MVALFCTAAGAQTRQAKLRPVDEAGRDPSFLEFRSRLIEAVARRDADFVMGVLEPNILVDFGGGHGPGAFREHWKLDRPEASELWDQLGRVLALGGRFQGEGEDRQFWAPYVFDFPPGFDGFEFGAILGSGVRARVQPDEQAAVVARLSFDVVQMEHPADGADWVRITTPDGQKAYVARRLIRSPIDYRAAFKRVGGRWVMRALVAGD